MNDPSDATAIWQWHGSRVAAIENPRGEIEWRLLAESAASAPMGGGRVRLTEIDPFLPFTNDRFAASHCRDETISTHSGRPNSAI
jgi:hypothetical protein